MQIIGGRLAAVAVAAQVGGDHGEMLGQLFGDLVPDDVGLRVPVQQQQARPAAADAVGDIHTVDAALVFQESGKHECLLVLIRCILKVLRREGKA
ncbi:hypothetical protein D3C85_1599190 [compost metagenome]